MIFPDSILPRHVVMARMALGKGRIVSRGEHFFYHKDVKGSRVTYCNSPSATVITGAQLSDERGFLSLLLGQRTGSPPARADPVRDVGAILYMEYGC